VNRFDIGTGVAGHRLNGNGFSLTKTGANEITLRAQFVTNVASIVINQGTLKHESFDQISPATGATTNIVNHGALLRSYGARTFNYPLVFNGLSTLDTENSAAVWTGPVTLNGTTTVNTAVNAITLGGAISGLGSLVKTNANSLVVLADNAYAGRTWLRGGRIQVGNNSATGTLGQGAVDLAPGGWLEYLRSNAVDVTSPVTGSGAAEFRHFGTGTLRLRSMNMTGIANLRVGFNALGAATLTVQPGDSITTGRLFVGENPSLSGRIVQTGGSITVTDPTEPEGPVRLGHWPTETSTYDLLGGTLSVPVGRISLGIDGHGIWNVNGGTATVVRVDVNGRSASAGDGGTLNLLAGRLRVGAGGIQSLGTPYAVNYGNGTLEATAPFTSPLNATLTGITPILTASHTITLSGVLGGAGGFSKAGLGTLALAGNNLYAGPVQVLEGELRLTGTHTGGGTLVVSAGARLTGTGATSAAVTVAAGGILAPGLGVGTLAVNGPLALDGQLEFQVNGATADRVIGVTDLTLGATSAVVLTNTLTAASYTLVSYTGTRSGEFGDIGAITAQGYTVVYDDAAKTVRAVFLPAPAVSGLAGTNLVFAWPTRASHLYTVQYRTNLLSGIWLDLPGHIDLPGTGAPISVTNTLGGEMRAYFRVMNE
jgi:fibronectin-binding autotransporter adhesin